MTKFRKKPVEVEAFRVGTSIRDAVEMPAWGYDAYDAGVIKPLNNGFVIDTLEGLMVARPGDWVVRGIKNELYPVKPDIFEQTYEPVDK